MSSGHRLFQTLPWYLWAMRIVVSETLGPFRRQPFSTSASTLRFKKSSLVKRQCRGIRRSDGLRCTRMVQADVICTDDTQLYCNHHQLHLDRGGLTMLPQPFADPILNGWDLWINKNMSKAKQRKLQEVIKQPLSEKEEAGYIYGFVLQRGPRVSTYRYAYFKIGRSVDPLKRMYQVAHTCNYTPELIEVLPNIPTSAKTKLELMKLPKCPALHRVEHLIHIELEGLFPRADFKCKECGVCHREWFRIKRVIKPDGNPSSDRELWMTHVRPVVLKWIQYGMATSIATL
ncbi:hypothetical protein BX666DRAFT_1922827 [Dichotomocladium elegans]|nr:hypothetical protein BX666DRAFT_1922827 [Dichotomocladium elegans]